MLEGEVALDYMESGEVLHTVISEGMLALVPRGTWHRPVAPSMVTLLAATPSVGSEIFLGDSLPRD